MAFFSAQQLVITLDDVVMIFKLDLIIKFYVMSLGTSVNDFEGRSYRQQLLKSHWLLVLKAFFCPTHVLNFIPSDLVNTMPYQDPGMLEIMQQHLPSQEQTMQRALQEMYKQTRRFYGMTEKSFQKSLGFMGYENRLDTLVRHFNLQKSDLIPLLYSIINATNQFQEQQASARFAEAAIQSAEAQETT